MEADEDGRRIQCVFNTLRKNAHTKKHTSNKSKTNFFFFTTGSQCDSHEWTKRSFTVFVALKFLTFKV